MGSELQLQRFRSVAKLGVVLALCVVMLGAWVRLSDAGLGCPDWPGCYGNMLVPESEVAVIAANEAYPERPLEADKAWKEMIHRYLAGGLGFLILLMSILAFRNRRFERQPVLLPLLLLGLVIFQALLGMWTVTLQLKPVIVMAHLLGGFATLSLLWWLVVSTSLDYRDRGSGGGVSWLVGVALVLLVGQIALGGWTSSNYAALACPDFPQCQQQWWPKNMDFKEGFVLWRGLDQNYEFGVLDHTARTAVHLTHRIGAIVVTSYLLALVLYLLFHPRGARVRGYAAGVLVLLLLQVSLGVSNVVFGLPLSIAVAHNGVAAMLLLSLLLLMVALARQDYSDFSIRRRL